MKLIVFEGHDNSFSLLLKVSTNTDPTLRIYDLTDVTRMVLARADGFRVDSDKEPTIFDWLTLATSGIVTVKLGSLNLKNTTDNWRLVVYEATNPNGIVWGDSDFQITVKEEYAVSS